MTGLRPPSQVQTPLRPIGKKYSELSTVSSAKLMLWFLSQIAEAAGKPLSNKGILCLIDFGVLLGAEVMAMWRLVETAISICGMPSADHRHT
jgi:hypothetical protein